MALKSYADAGLRGLITVFESLGSNEMKTKLSQKMGSVMLGLIRAEIDQSVDCYGRDMPPRTDGAAPLQGLRNAFSASFDSRGVQIGTSKWYSKVHNRGWIIRPKNGPLLKFQLPGGRWVSAHEVRIPRRQLVPSQDTGGLGPIWGPRLKETANDFMREYLRSGR